MGACTSKLRKYHSNDMKNASSSSSSKKKKKKIEQSNSLPPSSSINADQFAHVPFIDSEEKSPTTPPLSPTNTDRDEQTTVKNNFESNVSYSNTETIEKLKEEVLTFLREKILPFPDEKEKLSAYVLKRIIGNPSEKQRITEYLRECLVDIEKRQPIDQENNNNQIKNRLMHIITIYVASQSSDNSFLKALYDKMGTSLDLNSLNAETNEHELVQVTVTKRVRQVYLDNDLQSSPSTPNETIIQLSSNNGKHYIPDDLPEDLRRKAEEVLHSFNDVLHSKHC